MAVVFVEHRFVYLAHRYTGSNATIDALEDIGGRRSAGHHDGVSDLKAQGLITEGWLEGATVCTTVRNPFDALVTWWTRHDRGRSFRDFIFCLATLPEEVIGGSTEIVRGGRLYWMHLQDSNAVLRFERLSADLDAVLSRVGLPAVQLPHRNPTAGREGDYRGYYDPTTRALVEELFAVELASLGYTF